MQGLVKAGKETPNAEVQMYLPPLRSGGPTILVRLAPVTFNEPTGRGELLSYMTGRESSTHGGSQPGSSHSETSSTGDSLWVLIFSAINVPPPAASVPPPAASTRMPPANSAVHAVVEGSATSVAQSADEIEKDPMSELRWIMNNICAPAFMPQMGAALDLIGKKLEMQGVQADEPLAGEHLRPLEDEVIRLRNDLVEQRNISFAAQQSLEALQDKYIAAHEELQATNEELQSTNEELFIVNAEHRARISELIELNTSHEHLMVSSQVAMISLSTNLIIERFTAAAQRWLDWRTSDIGRSVDELNSSPLLQGIRQAVVQLDIKDAQVNYYKDIVRDQNQHFEVQARRHTQTASVVITVFNISEIMSAKAEQQRVADDLTMLIDTANAPIFGIDGSYLVNEWNRKAAEITGYSRDEVMGKDLVATYITPEFQESVRGVLRDALAGTQTSNYEFPLYTKTGERVEVLLNATSRQDASGRIAGVLGVGQDITEMKAAQAAKAHLDSAHLEIAKQRAVSEAKDMFLASMSHEIRTPLSALLGLLNQAADDSVLAASQPSFTKQHLNMARQAGMHLLHVVNDLLDFSKIASGKLTLDLSPCNLLAVCRSVVQMLSQLASEANLNVELESPDDLPEVVMTDEQRLRQVLTNLVHNALKFTHVGTVRLIVSNIRPPTSTEAYLHFAISDTGVGIAEEDQSRIFSAFEQHSAGKMQGKMQPGTGLGLSICKELVGLMGSKLQLRSKVPPHEDAGSTFFWEMAVRIPSKEALAAAAGAVGTTGASPPTSSPAPELYGMSPTLQKTTMTGSGEETSSFLPLNPPSTAPFLANVVLVEDDQLNQIVTSLFLQDYHRSVISNGLDAVVHIYTHLSRDSLRWGASEGGIDCCIMDVSMPYLLGNEVARLVRSMAHWHPYAASMPIVGATAHALASEYQKCIDDGMDACLTKPFNKESIVRAVSQATDRARAYQAELQLAALPAEAVRAGSGAPTSDVVLALQRKLAKLLADALYDLVGNAGNLSPCPLPHPLPHPHLQPHPHPLPHTSPSPSLHPRPRPPPPLAFTLTPTLSLQPSALSPHPHPQPSALSPQPSALTLT